MDCATGRRSRAPFRKRNLWAKSLSLTLMTALYTFALGGSPLQSQVSIQQLYEQAQTASSQGDLAGAEEKYLEVIRRSPQFALAYHNLGVIYFKQRKYQAALETLEKALKLNPRLGEAYAMKGLALYQLFQSQRAAEAFEKALRLNPNDTNALLYLAKSLIRTHDYLAAAPRLEKLKAMKANDPNVLYELSLCYMKLMLQAVDELGRAAPRSYQFWLLLAQDADFRGADNLAIRNYREAIKAKPEADGVHYALGSALIRVGKFDEAAEAFKKELQLNPNDTLALWRLGELTLRTDPQEARRYLEEAVKGNPEFPQAVLAFGRVLARVGETEKAIENFQHVVRLAPEEDSVHYHLAKAYRRLGLDEQAKAELVRFGQLAQKKSERKQAVAKDLMQLDVPPSEGTEEPEPSFSPSREPTHE